MTIRGSSLVNIGTPYCKFGSLPPVQGILLNESATALGEVLSGSHPSSGERISGVVCASPSHLVLRESIESRDCYTRDWHRFEETCGTQETMPLELSLTGVREALSGGRSGGFTSSHVPFTYHAFLTNPEDVITPPPPPPPPSPPPTPPPPSPPPPGPLDCNQCAAGFPCGICLMPIDPDECATYAPTPELLRRCDDNIRLDQLCEGDGECATDTELNSCPGGWDVYRRVSCTPYHPWRRDP